MADTGVVQGAGTPAGRDALLEAVAFAAQRFLRTPDWRDAADDVLARLGEAVGVSRTYIFENHLDALGRPCTSQRFEWCAPGIPSELDNPELQDEPWEEGFQRWADLLGAGSPVVGPTRAMRETERAQLEREGILSILIVPLFAGSEWWGTIGFDDCVEERVWDAAELDELRTVAGILGAVIERQRVQEELEGERSRYRALVESVPVLIYRESITQRVEDLYISPQAASMFGHEAEEWMTTPDFWKTHLHPDDAERVLDASARANETREPFELEYRLRRKDGSYVWISDTAVLVTDARGEPQYWQGCMIDVSERKRTEVALKRAERRWRTLVENMPAITYVESLTEETSDLYISPQAKEILGYTPEEWQGTKDFWINRIHPEDREHAREEDRRTNETGDPVLMEYRFRARDGRWVWLRDEARLVPGEDGEGAFWQGFMLDITDRKRAEEAVEHALEVEREATQRLRAVDELKNTFLQAVSHDLRTPLAAILGLAITLTRKDLELSEEDSRELADRIANNARRLQRLVTDLLDLDRLSRGIVEPQRHPTEIGALLRRVVAESEFGLDRPVEVVVADRLGIVVSVDAGKVERIVENLLANTARHTPPGTSVWVKAERTAEGVVIAVEDDGEGVPEADRARIFEPFRQGSGAPEHSPGMGVGLTLVSRFAELHGGRAWVEERRGGGASFRVLLPDRDPGLRTASGG